MVIDGNLKNRRDVCGASEAGFMEYEGLPGFVNSGCQLSPLGKSKYCYRHAPRICLRDIEGSPSDGVVKLITAKKETRNGIYYQVMHTPLITLQPIKREAVVHTIHLHSGSLARTRREIDLGTSSLLRTIIG